MNSLLRSIIKPLSRYGAVSSFYESSAPTLSEGNTVALAATQFMYCLNDMKSLETHFTKLASTCTVKMLAKDKIDWNLDCIDEPLNRDAVKRKIIKKPKSRSDMGALIEILFDKKTGSTELGLMYQGQFETQSEKFCGLGILRKGQRNYYKGQFDNGVENGRGVQFIKGNKYQGEFVAGKLEGDGTIYFKDGTILCGCFQNGKLHGLVEIQLCNGIRRECLFLDGKVADKNCKIPSSHLYYIENELCGDNSSSTPSKEEKV